MTTPKPFKISVPQEKLDKFKLKLSLTEFPDELDNSGWDYGVPLADMKRLTKAYEKWDWRQAEARLNKLPQYTTPIKVDGFDELDIHFIWSKSEVKNAIPLLMLHGVWPASFIEFQHVIPLLQKPGGPAFHIVAPSLPNFGFSEGVKARGFALPQYAEACHKLMLSLGYTEYATQGGDWGWIISRGMGRIYPESVKANHINTVWSLPPPDFDYSTLTEKEKKGLARSEWFIAEGHGYFKQQSHTPQTLAYALNDSPVALLAWIYEKLYLWTDNYPWTDDEIFTWISVYAFSRAGPGASTRIYYEAAHKPDDRVGFLAVGQNVPHVKLGMAHNPGENSVQPLSWSRHLGEIVYEKEHESGGHFMASERPEWLVNDLVTMFGKGGGAFGCIKGKNGYDDA